MITGGNGKRSHSAAVREDRRSRSRDSFRDTHFEPLRLRRCCTSVIVIMAPTTICNLPARYFSRAHSRDLASVPTKLLILPHELLERIIQKIDDWPTLLRLRGTCRCLRAMAGKEGLDTGRPRPEVPFDECGVLHLLGSSFGCRAWRMPELARRVRVFTSEASESALAQRSDEGLLSPEWKGNSPVHLLNFEDSRGLCLATGCLTGGGELLCASFTGAQRTCGSWYALDFGPLVHVAPSQYSMRHSSAGRALRSWRLEGSNSPTERWDILDERINDSRLSVDPHSSATWTADGSIGGAYRYLRVVKIGPDALGADRFHLSGIEIFGRVWVGRAGEAAAAATAPPPPPVLTSLHATPLLYNPRERASWAGYWSDSDCD